MTISSRGIPGVDDEGFASAEEVRARALRTAKDEFVRVYPVAGLVVALSDPTPASGGAPVDADTTVERSIRETSERPAPRISPEAARYLGRVAFLSKRPGNPFPQMVSVGRALNNDIVLVLETVSKVHGYFMKDAELWKLTDQRSTNGCFVNGRRVAPGAGVPLADGDLVKLGLEISFVFLSPAGLYDRARGA